MRSSSFDVCDVVVCRAQPFATCSAFSLACFIFIFRTVIIFPCISGDLCLVFGNRQHTKYIIRVIEIWISSTKSAYAHFTCLDSLLYIVSRRPSLILILIPVFSFFLFKNFSVIWWHVSMCERIWLKNSKIKKKTKSESKSDVKEFSLPSRSVVFRLHWAASSLFSFNRTRRTEAQFSSAQFVSLSHFYAKAK